METQRLHTEYADKVFTELERLWESLNDLDISIIEIYNQGLKEDLRSLIDMYKTVVANDCAYLAKAESDEDLENRIIKRYQEAEHHFTGYLRILRWFVYVASKNKKIK